MGPFDCPCETDTSDTQENSDDVADPSGGNDAADAGNTVSLPVATGGPDLDRSALTYSDYYGGNPGAEMFSQAGVNYSDGEVNIGTTDISSSAQGEYLGIDRTWTNEHDDSGSIEEGTLLDHNGGTTFANYGDGWAVADEPTLYYNYKGNYVVQNTATDATAFAASDFDSDTGLYDTYTSIDESSSSLTLVGDTNLVYADAAGDQEVFPTILLPGYQPDATSFVNAYGQTTVFDAGVDQYRDTTVDGQTVRNELSVASTDTDLEDDYDGGPISSIEEETITNPGPSQTAVVQRIANYTYYGSADADSNSATFVSSHGDPGDLRSATITDASGNPISKDFYVYYTSSGEDASHGYNGALKFVFSSLSYAKMVASLPSGTTVDNATDAEMAPYADTYLKYNSNHEVSQISIQGQGCSSCGGGIGTYSYTYADNGFGSSYGGGTVPDFNSWAHETTETLPDGNTNIVYSNYEGEPILKVYENTATDPTSPEQWRTAFRYDDAGRIIMEAQPSAVTGPTTLPDAATEAGYAANHSGSFSSNVTNLLGYNSSTGDYTNISNTEGVVELSEYYGDPASPVTGGGETVTEGNDTLPGGAAGYLEETWVQQGDGGGTAGDTTPIPQESLSYYTHSFNDTTTGVTIITHPEATDIVYRNNNGSGAETTSYAYTFSSNGPGIASITQTNAAVADSENGSGTATTEQTIYDQYGYPTWTTNADGYITYTQYDPVTGAIVREITDANPSTVSDPVVAGPTRASGLPTANPLTTTAIVDAEGRPIEITDPAGNVTCYVYDDTDHIEQVYPGWNSSTGTTTGPVQLYQSELPYTYTYDDQTLQGMYSQTLTYSPSSISVAEDGLPIGDDSISNVDTLSRSLTNAAGQVMETDQYFSLTGVTYNTSSVYLGSVSNDSSSGNYSATFYQYDSRGRLRREEAPTGTITDTEYDGLGRVTAVYVGTDDSTTDGWVWDPGPDGNASTTNNMVLVTAHQYDDGGVGDSNLTETVNYPSSSDSGRATVYYYDFRDRMIAMMTGAIEAADTIGSPAADTASNDTFVSYYTLDNLGEATETDTYNAEGAPVTFGTASILGPESGSDMVLTAAESASYDDQGRVFASSAISVDPTTHDKSTTDTTNTYYDGDGNVIASIGPTGAATKYVFNGQGWNTFTYSTDGGQLNNSSNITVGSSTAYAAAASISDDDVLTQNENLYDNDGDVIETITADRFGTDATTATGALGTPTTGVYARVSYTASYYDAANRDVADIDAGTFGGTAYDAPSVSTATGGSTTSLVNTSLSGSLSVTGDVLAILTGAGAGERATITGYNSSSHTFSFAALGIAPASGSTYIIVDPISMLTQTTYNPAGWVAESIDPKGLIALTSYDMLGRTLQTIADYTDGTPTDASNQTTDYTYDGDNHEISMTAVMPSGEVSQTTDYVYGVTTSQGSDIDDNDLLYEVEYPDPLTGTNTAATGHTYNQAEIYTYDATGAQISYTDRNGTTHEYAYDTLGRLTSDTITAFGTNVDESVGQLTYSYNNQGLLSYAESFSPSGSILNFISETYDGFEQLTNDHQYNYVSYGNISVGYTYNASAGDRLTAISYPDGETIDYNYNSGLDSTLSRISSVSDSSGSLQSYTYLGLETPVTFSDGNGVDLSYLGTEGATTGDAGDQYSGLDRFGRVIEQNWTGPYEEGPDVRPGIDQFQYGYDQDSNVLYDDNVTDTTSSATNTTLAAESQLYSYDNLNRLSNYSSGTLSISGGAASISGTASETEGWSLNALGDWNSNTVNGTATSRTTSAQNQVETVGDATLAYDANGNTTTDQSGQTYTYDAWNRLISVTAANGTLLEQYSYDAEGRRITQTQGQTTTNLFYSDQGQVVEEQQTGFVTADHVWSPFYVNDLIETTTDPKVTTGESNGSLSGSSSTPADVIGDDVTGEVAVFTDQGDTVVAAIIDGNLTFIAYYGAYLDGRSFGTDGSGDGTGVISTSYYTDVTNVTSAVAQADGTIDVLVGSDVVELNPDGSFVSSFGSDGVATLDSSMSNPFPMAIAANGDVLIAGLSSTSNTTIEVTELDPNTGDVVSGFGSDGIASVNITGAHMFGVTAMQVQPGGDIIVENGYESGTHGVPNGIVLAAFTPAGAVDTTFGSSGVTKMTYSELGGLGDPSEMTIGPDGQIYLGGNGSGDNMEVACFTTGGLLDTSFGTSGVAGLTGTDETELETLGVSVNGDITLGAGSPDGDFVLVRFLGNGSIDDSFGSDGLVEEDPAVSILGVTTAINGDITMVGEPDSDDSLVVDTFNTITPPQKVYAVQDADYNVVCITDSSGNVLERYRYDSYGNVTVLNPDGTVRGDGTLASSQYGWIVTDQGGWQDPLTGLVHFQHRDLNTGLGTWIEQDPAGYVNGPNRYQVEMSSPNDNLDPYGLSLSSGWVPGKGFPVKPLPGIGSGKRGLPGGYGYPSGQPVPGNVPVEYEGDGWYAQPPLGGGPPYFYNPTPVGGANYNPPTWETSVVIGCTIVSLLAGPAGELAEGWQAAQGGEVVIEAAENTLTQSGDRQALNSLIKEATNNGTKPLCVEDANTVLDWAEEQEIPGVRAGEGDVSVPSNWNANPDQPHIHIPGTGIGNHIPVEPGVPPR